MMTTEQVLATVQEILTHVEPELVVQDTSLEDVQLAITYLQAEGAHLRVRATHESLMVEDIHAKKAFRISETAARRLGRSLDMRTATLKIQDIYKPLRQEVLASDRPYADLADAFELVERHNIPVEQVFLSVGGLAVLAADRQSTFGPDTDNVWGASVVETELPARVLAVVVGEGACEEDREGMFALVVVPS